MKGKITAVTLIISMMLILLPVTTSVEISQIKIVKKQNLITSVLYFQLSGFCLDKLNCFIVL